MNLKNYATMDPAMLYSLVNMKLRNEYADLDDLVLGMDLDRAVLERHLGEAGYHYEPALRQFRAGPPPRKPA